MSVKSRMHAPARRAAIVEEAVKLFAERGFRGTTTRDLAAACGVSEPVLYEHFATKRDLFTAIVEAKGQESFERFQTLVGPYAKTDDDRRFFEGLGQLVLEFYEDNPDHVRLMTFSVLESREISDLAYNRHREAMHDTVIRYIERRIAAGAFRPLNPALAARAFVGMLAHYGWSSTMFRCKIPGLRKKQIVEGMVNLFLGGISAPGAARTEVRSRSNGRSKSAQKKR